MWRFCVQRRCSSAASFKKQLDIQDIPGPKGLPLIGNTLSFIAAGHTERHHEYIDSLHRKYGPIIHVKIGPIGAVYVSDPELMRTVFFKLEGKHPAHILPEPWLHYNKLYGCKRGLLFMEGEEWLQNRRILNKILLKNDGDAWMETSMKAVAHQLIERWNSNMKDKSISPDLEFETYRLSIDAVISLLWGTEYNTQKQRNYENLLAQFSKAVQKIFSHSAKMYVLPATVYERIGSSAWRGFVESVNTSLTLGAKIVNEILDRKLPSDGLLYRLTQENMKRSDIERIAVDFILAAGDTTAVTTQWTLYLLSNHVDVVEEARRVESKNYIKGILKESMRLYPVAPFIARFLPEDSLLGDFRLEAGTLVVLSTYTSGRNPNNFYNPDQFLPQRWWNADSNPNQGAHIPYAMMPFAMGARSCIGRKIAMYQLSEVIGSIINNYNMTSLNNKDIDLIMRMVSVPSEPIKIKFTVR